MKDHLFKLTRVCCCCKAEATNGKKIPGEPNIIAITPVVYRKGAGKAQLANAPRVQICEPCLTEALTEGRLSWLSPKPNALWNALKSSLLERYSALVESDAQ